MAAVVTSGERVSRRALDPAPADAADLPGWYLASLDQTLDVLGSADPESPTWTFSSRGDLRVGWWQRLYRFKTSCMALDLGFQIPARQPGSTR
jgi:hypothetical protein